MVWVKLLRIAEVRCQGCGAENSNPEKEFEVRDVLAVTVEEISIYAHNTRCNACGSRALYALEAVEAEVES